MQFLWPIQYKVHISKYNRLDKTVRKFGVRRKELETRDKKYEKQHVITFSIYSLYLRLETQIMSLFAWETHLRVLNFRRE